jgi:hypothetical protein
LIRLLTFLTLAVLLVIVLLAASNAPAHTRPPTATQSSCHTRACWERVRQERRWDRCVRINGGEYCTWRNRFRRKSAHDRQWAVAVANCETHGVPWSRKASFDNGNRFLGALQFHPDTAWRAGFRKPVTQTTIWEQLVRGIGWAHRVNRYSTAGWPNCP